MGQHQHRAKDAEASERHELLAKNDVPLLPEHIERGHDPRTDPQGNHANRERCEFQKSKKPFLQKIFQLVEDDVPNVRFNAAKSLKRIGKSLTAG